MARPRKSIMKKLICLPNKILTTLDENLLPFLPAATLAPYCVQQTHCQPFQDFSFDDLDPAIISAFNVHKDLIAPEYLYHYTQPCSIEPRRGWVITQDHRVIFESLPCVKREKAHKPSFYRQRIARKKTQYLPVAASIRGSWTNYWHFHDNALGQLTYLDRCGVDPDIPIVITQKKLGPNFVQEVMKKIKRNWVIQDEETFIETDQVYFCKNASFVDTHFKAILSLLNNPPADPNQNEKIFLTRSQHRKRHIQNAEQIENIARACGFRVIDSDDLSYLEQVALFSTTRYLVGIHGAGLTNIIHRSPAHLALLEIFPKNLILPYYFRLAKGFGFDYDALCGGEEHNKPYFSLDPEVFEDRLKRFLSRY